MSLQDSASGAAAPNAARIEFESFFKQTYPRLTRALYLVLADAALAEDVAQEALVRTWQLWPRVRSMESPDGFVFKVALNLSRKTRRRPLLTAVDLQDVDLPERAPDQADLRMAIHEVLQALPVEQREAVVLIDWLGMDSKAAGELLAVAPSSVRGRVHRARRTLRRKLRHWSPTTEVSE